VMTLQPCIDFFMGERSMMGRGILRRSKLHTPILCWNSLAIFIRCSEVMMRVKVDCIIVSCIVLACRGLPAHYHQLNDESWILEPKISPRVGLSLTQKERM
jgi:hypothetical protein